MDRSIVVTRTCKVPYKDIVDQFDCDAPGLIRMATEAAASVANDIVLTLDSKWAWFDVHERVRATVGDLTRSTGEARMPLSWIADAGKRVLPGVDGELTFYAMSTSYSEIGFTGRFTPPHGLVGSASGLLLGRRVAQASVGHFLDQLVDHLEQADNTPAATNHTDN